MVFKNTWSFQFQGFGMTPGAWFMSELYLDMISRIGQNDSLLGICIVGVLIK